MMVMMVMMAIMAMMAMRTGCEARRGFTSLNSLLCSALIKNSQDLLYHPGLKVIPANFQAAYFMIIGRVLCYSSLALMCLCIDTLGLVQG